MNVYLVIVLALVTICQGAYYEESFARLNQEVQEKPKTWQFGYNQRFQGMTEEQMKAMLGARLDSPPRKDIPQKRFFSRTAAVPESFDARQQWPQCQNSIGHIKDQSACGSCWAVSSASVMSDRMCIKSNGTNSPFVSDTDILACCTQCGDGCAGGWPLEAFRFWTAYGVCTGGPYGSTDNCKPYAIAPGASKAQTPQCTETCQNSYTKHNYYSDEMKGKAWYQIAGGPTAMQQEIMEHGPIVACFEIYEDFYHYTEGVYHHVSGKLMGGHAVRVIGWGTENNTPYWLVTNSWNAGWGLQGLFKIRRGNDECQFESQQVSAGSM